MLGPNCISMRFSVMLLVCLLGQSNPITLSHVLPCTRRWEKHRIGRRSVAFLARMGDA